ncbi:MAG: antibiotic biosynthesis monooxygenase, partial [Acidimicrobiia bacterium]|nr:antibiotic biosynthesis monooxygenase [Acidimicrobiia bacterium]
MFAVITHVRLKPGRIDDVRERFRRTTPPLVAEQEDWVSVTFAANRRDDEVTIIARWKNADSYRAFAAGDAYKAAMAELSQYFGHPPTIDVNEILVELG